MKNLKLLQVNFHESVHQHLSSKLRHRMIVPQSLHLMLKRHQAKCRFFYNPRTIPNNFMAVIVILIKIQKQII